MDKRVLHYTGMGKSGDQDIHWAQNATLAACGQSDVDIHLFEVINSGEYIYCGRIELVDEPYIDIQPGEDGIDRKVWMFPIRPVPDNDVEKPAMFVFKDIDDYRLRGKNVDEEYSKIISKQKKAGKMATEKTTLPLPVSPPAHPKPAFIVPPDIIGRRVNHKSYGEGTITNVVGTSIVVAFNSVGEKRLGYEFCIKNTLIEFV